MTNIAGLEWLRSKFTPLKTMLKIFTRLSMIGSTIVVLDNSRLESFVDGPKFKTRLLRSHMVFQKFHIRNGIKLY